MSQDVYIIPTSFAQERLWLLDRLDPGSPALNLPASVRLAGELRAGALRWSLREIVRRHEALRTTFVAVEGKPAQVIHPDRSIDLSVVDLAGLPEELRAAEAEALGAREALLPFDLRRGPLLRAVLLRQDERLSTLLLTMHHIVSDGWSIGVLVRELSALYAARVEGKPSGLPELTIQYADWACWQRERLQGEVLDQELGYWRERLQGLAPGELLTGDHPRGDRGEGLAAGRACTASFLGALPADLSEELRALARSERCTLFAVLLAAFLVLLHRLSGREDVTVGSPVAGRSRSETRDLIGLFLNTLVLRADLSGQPTFRKALARVREALSGALAHQEVPFEKLIEELRPERSRTPFFQIFFNMLSFPRGELSLPDLRVEYLAAPESDAKFDLEVYAEDQQEGVRFRWVYDAGLFAGERMDEIRCQYERLLRQAVAQPDQAIGALSLLTERAVAVLPDPRMPLGNEWNGAVHEALTRQALRDPARPAVADRDGAWTYGELEARCNRLAHRLLAAGVGRGDLVAIYGYRCKDLVVAVLGVLKAGATYTVLDPAYPAARHAGCLRLAPARAWISLRPAGPPPGEVEDLLGASSLLCRIELGGGDGAAESVSSEAPRIAVGPDDIAYVAFTSGSTGEPKGILGRHGPLSHFLPWQGERFGLTADDRYSMLSGLAHDPLQRDIFTPLWFGARLCVPDPDRLGAPGWLSQWMAREGISVSHLTPAMGRLLTDTAPADLRIALRRAFFVGEALIWSDHARLRRLAPQVTCVNLYGSTETQRAVAFYELPERRLEDGEERAALPLGRGMKDVQLLLLNGAGALVGVGEVGEIHVRSPHLALGYIDRRELTAERFLTNPLTGAPEDRSHRMGDPEDRVYRTGDLGRYLPDGNVEFLGRADDQVQIRGFRVEPAEIQRALSQHPGLRQAAVIAWGEGLSERRLAAYVVPAEPPGPSIADLRAFLRRLLPEYMVPAALVKLPQLPLQPNGKLDRRALPSPEETGLGEETFIAPRTPLEEILAALWSELLGVERVSAADGFFDLGGHSLLATQLVARLEETFRLQVPLRLVFDAPTLAEQAQRLERLRQDGAAREAAPLAPWPRDREAPLSFAQQRLWFLDQLAPGSPLYNLPAAVRLEGALSTPGLRAALAEVVRRHEALRTVFAQGKEGAVQRILPHLDLALPVACLDTLPLPAAEELARRLIAEEAARPFDLSAGPLVRAVLFRLRPERHIALLTTHHAVSDRWSANVLFREVALLYGAFIKGRPSPLPELPVQYADFALWQRQWIAGEVLERELSYWQQQLAGAPEELRWPGEAPRGARPTGRGGVELDQVDAGLRQRLETLARREGSTLFMVLAAAFQVVLHQMTGADDLVVGTDVANRTRLETEGLIGFFVNQLVLRCDLSGDPAFTELLLRVRETTLSAYAHQNVPFQKLVERLRPGRDSERSPLFQVKVNLHNVPAARVETSGLVLTLLEVERGIAQLDLIVNLTEEEGGAVRIRGEYSSELFKPAAVRQMLRKFQQVLGRVAEEPSARLSALREDLARADREESSKIGRELEATSLSAMKKMGRKAILATGEM